jgi:hypothetical protein
MLSIPSLPNTYNAGRGTGDSSSDSSFGIGRGIFSVGLMSSAIPIGLVSPLSPKGIVACRPSGVIVVVKTSSIDGNSLSAVFDLVKTPISVLAVDASTIISVKLDHSRNL